MRLSLNVNDYDVLVIPGGYAPDRIRRNKTALELTRKFYESGKVLEVIDFLTSSGSTIPSLPTSKNVTSKPFFCK